MRIVVLTDKNGFECEASSVSKAIPLVCLSLVVRILCTKAKPSYARTNQTWKSTGITIAGQE